MIVKKNGILCLILLWSSAPSLGLAQDAEPPQCSNMVAVASWHQCVGQVERAGGGRYYGEFSNGQPHGLGREVSIDGAVYVGSFVYGKRIGTGIEYSSSRQVRRSGIWSGDFQRQVSVDVNLFPYEGPFAKNFFANFYGVSAVRSTAPSSSNSAERPVVLQERIEFLESKIKELESVNQNLRRELESHSKRTGVLGEDLVKVCLSKGLKPGSVAFSKCIAER